MKSAKPILKHQHVFVWCVSIYKDYFYTTFLHEIKENILTIMKMVRYQIILTKFWHTDFHLKHTSDRFINFKKNYLDDQGFHTGSHFAESFFSPLQCSYSCCNARLIQNHYWCWVPYNIHWKKIPTVNLFGWALIAADHKSRMAAQHFNTNVVKVFLILAVLFITYFKYVLTNKRYKSCRLTLNLCLWI